MFVSKLPQNKKKPGFPVGGPSSKWCPELHNPTSDWPQLWPENRICQQIISGQPQALGMHTSIVAKFQQSSETSYWAQALNMKMASWSEPEGIRSNLQNSLPYHPLPHTPQYSHSASRINPATRHTHSTTRTAHITLKGPELRHLPVLTTSSCCLEGRNNRKGRQVICPLTVHHTGTVGRVPHHLTLSSTHPERPWFCWLVNSPGVHMIKKSSFIKSDIWINEIELRVQK